MKGWGAKLIDDVTFDGRAIVSDLFKILTSSSNSD